jgi:hypothetical protein
MSIVYLIRFASESLLKKIKTHILSYMSLEHLTLLEINTLFEYAFMKEYLDSLIRYNKNK